MTIIYQEEHADVQYIVNATVGVIGYGHIGQPFALNLRDSGIHVLVSEHDDAHRQQAMMNNFELLPIDENVFRSHILILALPDEVLPKVYIEQISPNLQRDATLIFASAYNITFGYIEPPPFVDVGLVAPRTIGDAVRERYLNGQGFHSFVAVAQDASGRAWQTVLALAKALGSLRAGAMEIGFEQEAHLDLFMQQAILPIFHHMIVKAAKLLVGIGYPPEAVMSDLYLSGEFADYLQRATRCGLMDSLRRTSITSQYGTLSRMDRFNDLKLERLMEVTLNEIRTGIFAKEWANEHAGGYRRLNTLLDNLEHSETWEWEQQTLDLLFPFRDTQPGPADNGN